jgi:AbrB family looped-hinge helix DNA binding protein
MSEIVRLTARGGISIPVKIRRELGWRKGSMVDYFTKENGDIVIKIANKPNIIAWEDYIKAMKSTKE